MKVDVDLTLAPLDSTDAEIIRQWRNDYRIWHWCRQSDLISDVEQRAWYERQAADPSIKMYKLVLKASGHDKTVGVGGLTSIDWLNRRAEFSLYIRPDCQRRGYARAGLTILLEHGFKNLGLHQIWGETFDGNPAYELFLALGMRLDGTRRQFYYRDGRFIDAHLVSILSEEWHALRNPDGPHTRRSAPVLGVPKAEPDADAHGAGEAKVAAIPRRQGRARAKA